jgi:hypothetical protein
MTIHASGTPIKFSEIAAEFGLPPGRNIGAYRISQTVGTLSNLPLDSGIPQSGAISFGNFYSKKLNVVLNCTGLSDLQTRINARSLYETPAGGVSISVIGGFVSPAPYDTSTSKVYINTNTRIGSNQGDERIVAFRTGTWQSGTDLRLENGSAGVLLGSGGDGGPGGGPAGANGANGTSGLGIDYPTTIVNRGTILSGGGGGGGGGGGYGRARYRRGFGFAFTYAYSGGGGGGGGSGYPAGGGAAGGQYGGSGSLYAAGGGGGGTFNSAPNCNAYGGVGGGGGTNANGGGGESGAQSSSGSRLGGQYAGSPGAGGGAGYAIIFYNDSSGSSITNYGTITGSYAYNSAIF